MIGHNLAVFQPARESLSKFPRQHAAAISYAAIIR